MAETEEISGLEAADLSTPQAAAAQGVKADFLSPAFYRAVVDQIRDIVLILSPDGSILDANQAALDAYGYSLPEIRRLNVVDLRAPETLPEMPAQFATAKERGILFRTIHCRKNGEPFPVEVSSRQFCLLGTKAVVSIVRDISETAKIEETLRASEEKLRQQNEELTATYEELLASEEELRQQFAELSAREEKIRRRNAVLASLHSTALALLKHLDLGEVLREIVTAATRLFGTPDGFINLVDEERQVFVQKAGLGRFTADSVREVKLLAGLVGQAYATGQIAAVRDYRTWPHRFPGPLHDDLEYFIVVPLKDDDKVFGVFGLGFSDPGRVLDEDEIFLLQNLAALASIAIINARLYEASVQAEKKLQATHAELTAAHEELLASDEELRQQFESLERQQKEIEYLAYHDALTNLPNRYFLWDHLERALAHAARGKEKIAVFMLDLDDFKLINDTLGHLAGDEFLKGVGGRLRAALRKEDIVARLGGDEFVIIAENIKRVANVSLIAAKIVQAVAQPWLYNGRTYYLTCSIGIAVFPDHGRNADELLRQADIAMYQAKSCGKGRFHLYSADMADQVSRRLEMEADLRRALDNWEFVLHYQPQVDFSGRIAGVEALLRWQHPAKGLIPPLDFIPFAEETSFIANIGARVLKLACHQAKQWEKEGLPPVFVSVNLSARQFHQRGLLQAVSQALAQAELPPDRLTLEITETVAMQNASHAGQILRDLSAMGVKIALDDFGTGYSSLNYLKNLPVSTLKIDRSFIRDIQKDPQSATITRAIVALAKNLGYTVVAEGVETAEQLKFLREMGCDQIQGYFFSQPLPASAISEQLRAGPGYFLAKISATPAL